MWWNWFSLSKYGTRYTSDQGNVFQNPNSFKTMESMLSLHTFQTIKSEWRLANLALVLPISYTFQFSTHEIKATTCSQSLTHFFSYTFQPMKSVTSCQSLTHFNPWNQGDVLSISYTFQPMKSRQRLENLLHTSTHEIKATSCQSPTQRFQPMKSRRRLANLIHTSTHEISVTSY